MRVCFHLQVRSDRLEEYRRLHREVWPELLPELKAAGIRDYSIWLWKDGHEFGVLECEDWEAVQQYLGKSEVVARWEAFMSGFLATPVEPGTSPELLEEVFRLE